MQTLKQNSRTIPSKYKDIDNTGFNDFESAQRIFKGIEVVNIIRNGRIADSRKTTFKTFCSLAA